MYVTERGEKFRAWERIRLPDGTVKKISVTMEKNTPQSRRKAQAELEKKAALLCPGTGLTYPQVVAMYITWQKSSVKMSTWTRNKATLERLTKTFGNVKFEKMTAGYISTKLLTVTDNPGTYNEYLARLKALFRWAYRHDFLESKEVVEKLERMKEDESPTQKVAEKYLEPEELKAVLDAASPYYRAIFEFLALSGLRIGELIALNDDDVTQTDIIVRRTYDHHNDVMNTPKTEAGWRYVHIQPELAACIARLRKITKQNCLVSRQRPPWFVVSHRGGRLSYESANRRFKALCTAHTPKALSIHALRHTHVALMAAEGIPLEAISRRLGHSDSRVTKAIYYHVTKKQKAKDDAAFDSASILA